VTPDHRDRLGLISSPGVEPHQRHAAGTVGLGEANGNNEDVGYDLIWSLTRAEE